MTYAEKLKDPRWQKKRLEILNKRGLICDRCGGEDKPIHIHHGWYTKNTDPWNYPDHCFHVLCEDCHDRRHSDEKWLKELVGSASSECVSDLLRLLESLWLPAVGTDPYLHALVQVFRHPDLREAVLTLSSKAVEREKKSA